MVKTSTNKRVILGTFTLEFLIIGSALLRAFLLNVDPKRYFDDKGYVSWFSFLQILLAAYLAWRIYKSRKSNAVINNPNRDSNKNRSYNFWAIVSFGFLFLGLDEILKIHENLDFFIHDVFQIQETNNTDRIDSLIVLFYALCGGGIVYWAKSELRKFKLALPLFSLALFVTFMMIFLDLLTDSRDVIYWIITNENLAYIVHRSLSIVEEICKIIAQGIFIITLHRCLVISKNQKYSLKKSVVKEKVY
ncbi:hypothetical protein Riv7116_4697 [Rivularia sp. PCC 7116]|uniref:hypothetical protein n=1 Tax=Rivularia sp. PCC 7116 TaxID=373994 RepID=UPI00029F18D2|nr:hypothetical protein [Rivularia sp. PCC 7116]AFY57114.1 hypothetical protein Riv7116_4697 [Rivularia sp. PCC 7116]